MKKNTKIVIIIIIMIAMIGSLILLKNKSNKEREWNNELSEVDKNEINYKEDTNVNELKEEMGLLADSSLYEITKEYDGRKTLNIKADISYKVAFAGIIKQSKLTLEEIDEVYNENYPNENGIWISPQSREKFLKLIQENVNSEYKIDENGYLTVLNVKNLNENDKKLNNLINSNKKIIIDINNFDYEVDVVTGEIIEYPFEQLGETIDIVLNNNDKIIVITRNQEQKFNNKEVFENFINNI